MSVNAAERADFFHSLKINRDVCVGCTHCITKCPTRALRIRNGKAVIYENWCVDCGECKKVCPVGAIYIQQTEIEEIFNFECRAALLPSLFMGQFPETTSEQEIYDAIYELGFTHIFPVEMSADVVRGHMQKEIENAQEKPSISAYCPAIVRLIQVKFPDLVDHIMTVKPPVEATAMLVDRSLREEGYSREQIGIFYVTPCAAKIASLKENPEYASMIEGVINLDYLYNRVCHILQNKSSDEHSVSVKRRPPMVSSREMGWSLTSGEADNFQGRCFAVDEIHNVIEFIERTSMTGEIHNIDFLELRACDRGCVGGVLTPVNRFLAGERLHKIAMTCPSESNLQDTFPAQSIEDLHNNINAMKPEPKGKLKYEGDINEVLRKMNSVKNIFDKLPGIDCGACGSPGCKSLAEDIVRGEARFDNCVFMQREMEKSGVLSSEQSRSILEEVWGKERSKAKSNHKNETKYETK